MHVLINKGNCASTDCLMEETSLQKMKTRDDEDRDKMTPMSPKRTLQKKYPSEPNLRSCYFGITDESDHCGNGVEAIAAVNSTGYASGAAGVAGKVGVSLWDLVTIARATQADDSSRERLYSLNGTQQSMLTDDERPSMSPITKSTRRMPKYMQVSGDGTEWLLLIALHLIVVINRCC